MYKVLPCEYEESEQDWKRRADPISKRLPDRKRCKAFQPHTLKPITWRGIPDIGLWHCDVCGSAKLMPGESVQKAFTYLRNNS
jgi:hypothetical protein